MGAVDYIAKPFEHQEIIGAIEKITLEHAKETIVSMRTDHEPPVHGMIGSCPQMMEMFRRIRKVAQTTSTVLINGESGTGKELVAKAIHNLSGRGEHEIVSVNCAAIPESLIESELFGHEKDAFVGATSTRTGLVETANGSTLFLDEIGELPLEAQARLLRVLQESEIRKVGSVQSKKVDVRLVVATHSDLKQLVVDGNFREDLFHRINVIRVHVPKLSERKEDIPQLAKHFFLLAASELDMEPKFLSRDVTSLFSTLEWPGNVRELENMCRWLTVMAAGREVLLSDLPPEIRPESGEVIEQNFSNWKVGLKTWAEKELSEGNKNILSKAVPDFEKTMIELALSHTNGRKRDASVLLGWGRNTLTRKLQEYDLESR